MVYFWIFHEHLKRKLILWDAVFYALGRVAIVLSFLSIIDKKKVEISNFNCCFVCFSHWLWFVHILHLPYSVSSPSGTQSHLCQEIWYCLTALGFFFHWLFFSFHFCIKIFYLQIHLSFLLLVPFVDKSVWVILYLWCCVFMFRIFIWPFFNSWNSPSFIHFVHLFNTKFFNLFIIVVIMSLSDTSKSRLLWVWFCCIFSLLAGGYFFLAFLCILLFSIKWWRFWVKEQWRQI